MLLAGRYKFQGLALIIPDIPRELQCDVHSLVLACSHLCLLKSQSALRPTFTFCRLTLFLFSWVTMLILSRPGSSKMGRDTLTAGIVLGFLQETSRNRILSNRFLHVHGGGFEWPPLLSDLNPGYFSCWDMSRIKCWALVPAQLIIWKSQYSKRWTQSQ
jgi:hypothetical protein